VDDVSVRLPRDIVKRVKLLAVERDTTIKKLITEMLLKVLEEEEYAGKGGNEGKRA